VEGQGRHKEQLDVDTKAFIKLHQINTVKIPLGNKETAEVVESL
jgi:hypothetical protein